MRQEPSSLCYYSVLLYLSFQILYIIPPTIFVYDTILIILQLLEQVTRCERVLLVTQALSVTYRVISKR